MAGMTSEAKDAISVEQEREARRRLAEGASREAIECGEGRP